MLYTPGTNNSTAVPTTNFNPDEERIPPLPPTPLDFPNYSPNLPPKPLNEESCNELHRLLAAIRKPQDVSPAHLEALNLTAESDIPISDIVPSGVLKTLPPYQWTEQPPTTNASETVEIPIPVLMSNGCPFPTKERYDLLKEETLYDNDDAFRTVSRLAFRPGREKIKLTQSRKFWAGLDQIAQYWDTTLDQYIERPPDDGPSKDGNEASGKMHVDDSPAPKRHIDVGQVSRNRTVCGAQPTEISNEPCKTPNTKSTYIGRRIGTGHECPEDVREETLRGFMEMIAWPFGCQASIPTLPPRLQLKGMLFPVRQNFVVARSPQDRQIARKGILEGPMIFVQCRGETSFHDKNNTAGDRCREICDLLREVAAMLLFAQERARDGATETRPGDGKWWTTTPRWGGADNSGPEADKSNIDKPKEATQDSEDRLANKRSKCDRTSLPFRRHGSSGSKKLSVAERWKILQPGPSMWDRKMRYTQIGTDRVSSFDDIFMVSSINHHFSILHLRVHSKYLEWLTTGKVNVEDETGDSCGTPWYALQLRRTRWLDLLDANDRLEGLNGLWALFSWLMR
ncbi:uncharacterized protein PADG_05261 [Paracoccidioides brasiliensis Pb18]|uniref:Uncharacterized protein n=1 Tax=Paracoccidioides brasiliensis (strain Pb18) TaxID=502780 RepID=C1GDC5_PARBD|nr:uncharacterized protein PADG_05261 [Paracoccidioides brasiliensis Pb18]EEH49182.2 hypothetical protein PADG_05261 [Paracoccidioides brasiliensis Pb18]